MVTLLAGPTGQLAADPARVGANQNWDVENASSNESSAEKALRIGIRAYVTGDLKLAIASLGTALQGPLPSNQTARALYYRGLAHRKQGMPGWAISDLTRALQQQDGLSNAERADAEDNRTAASREAGLPATESAVVTSPAEEAPIASAALAVRNLAPAASKNPAPELLWEKPIVTGSVAPTPEPRQTSSGWSAAMAIPAVEAAPSAAVSSAFLTQVAAVPVLEKKFEPQSGVHLQVATASRSQAFALSVRLTSQYGGEFGGRKLELYKTLAESRGATYRLRLGPYANAEEPQELCVSLRAAGYECFVE
jgi:hypothetical protein